MKYYISEFSAFCEATSALVKGHKCLIVITK